jgi:hypothetical protein
MNLDLIPDKDRTVVQLVLTGTLSVTDRAALDAHLDKYSRLFAWIGLWDRHCDLAVVPDDAEFCDLGIGGFAASAVAELVATARSSLPRRAGRAGRPGVATAVGRAPKRCRMRLHRLVLTNYRGIAHREIEFPDRGVTVVSGPNEVGKSSLIEALDLLLESRIDPRRRTSSRSSPPTPTSARRSPPKSARAVIDSSIASASTRSARPN